MSNECRTQAHFMACGIAVCCLTVGLLISLNVYSSLFGGLDRRHADHLSTIASSVSSSVLSSRANSSPSSSSSGGGRTNRIVQENLLPGSAGFWYDQNNATTEFPLYGYATRLSHLAGQIVSFKTDINPNYRQRLQQLASGSNASGDRYYKSHSNSYNSNNSSGELLSHLYRYRLEIYRLGYYQGHGGRLLATLLVSPHAPQPDCLLEPTFRMVDCSNWLITVSWQIPSDAVSGYFVALPVMVIENVDTRGVVNVTVTKGGHIPFIVRPSVAEIEQLKPNNAMTTSSFSVGRNSYANSHSNSSSSPVGTILFKAADTTWVAYNKFGGWNLYRGNGSLGFNSRAFAVSYNRPFNNRLVKHFGQHENFLFSTEYPTIRWLEKLGYNVYYATCYDVEVFARHHNESPRNSRSHSNTDAYTARNTNNTKMESSGNTKTRSVYAGLLNRFSVLLSVGHDEYWTGNLRTAFTSARDNGVNLGFLSSNELFWRIQWLPNRPKQRISTASEARNSRNRTAVASYANNHTMYNSLSSLLTMYSSSLPTFVARSSTHRLIDLQRLLQWHHSSSSDSNGNRHANSSYSYSYSYNDNNDWEQLLTTHADSEPRIIICRKETLDNLGFTTPILGSPGRDKDRGIPIEWTGTNRDARGRKPEPEHTLTGQHFQVNGYRADALEVRSQDARMRLWRNTLLRSQLLPKNATSSASFVYRTQNGILGYEWDEFRDDNNRPPGLIGLSYARMLIRNMVVAGFGTHYNHTAYVTHRLSMYRHVIKPQYPQEQPGPSTSQLSHAVPLTSLVFSTGTMQWAWALSSRHDGLPLKPDFNLQQATVNVLADMGVQPSGPPGHQLSRASASSDTIPPTSTISFSRLIRGFEEEAAKRNGVASNSNTNTNTNSNNNNGTTVVILDMRTAFNLSSTHKTNANTPHTSAKHAPSVSSSNSHSHSNSRDHWYKRLASGNVTDTDRLYLLASGVLVIEGTAVDLGGGQVASVEVSVDDGATWRLADCHYANITYPSTAGTAVWHFLYRMPIGSEHSQHQLTKEPNPNRNGSHLHANYANIGKNSFSDNNINVLRKANNKLRRSAVTNTSSQYVSVSREGRRRLSQSQSQGVPGKNTTKAAASVRVVGGGGSGSNRRSSSGGGLSGIDPTVIRVVTRAVDDSGWMEPTVKASSKSKRQKPQANRITVVFKW